MTYANLCRHCAAEPVEDPADNVPGLCSGCVDLAVWDVRCGECGRVPTGRERKPCYELEPAF